MANVSLTHCALAQNHFFHVVTFLLSHSAGAAFPPAASGPKLIISIISLELSMILWFMVMDRSYHASKMVMMMHKMAN